MMRRAAARAGRRRALSSMAPAEYGARREAVAAMLSPGEALLCTSNPPQFCNHDTEHPFLQRAGFAYLTGLHRETGAAVLLLPCGGEVLFARERDPAKEVWDGPTLGVDGAAAVGAVRQALPAAGMESALRGALEEAGVRRLLLAQGGAGDLVGPVDEAAARAAEAAGASARGGSGATLLDSARLVKTPAELGEMRAAAAAGARAVSRTVASAAPGQSELLVAARFHYEAVAAGAEGPSFPTIVASGANATVLHHTPQAAAPLEDGALVLLDAGARVRGYCSDISRVFPAGGAFSAEQRALYEALLEAQRAAIDAVRPGATMKAVHEASARTLRDGLAALGFRGLGGGEGDAAAAVRPYYPHGVGHFLGLDVHDSPSCPRAGALRAGMVVTVEPGVYVPAACEDAPAAFRGVGLRIEDDVAVGCGPSGSAEVLTAAVPKEVDEVEALMRM